MAPRFFLAFFILTSSLVAGQSPKYALKGGKVSLKPDIAEQPDGILWKHKGNKVVEFNGKEEQVYSAFDKRITLDWASAELQITDLRFEDSGEYELEVEVKKALHHRSFHKLEVIDTVAEPTISCKMNDGSSSSNSSAQLECSSESIRPQPLTKFEWSTRGNVQPGPKLRISLGDERDDEVYSCSVSNPLSNETATFTAKDCYPDKSSSIALIASLLSIFVLLLVGVGVGIWFCKRHHKACFAKGDLEKTSGTTEDKKEARANINRALLERASTRPSTQRLLQFDQAVDMDKQEEEPLTGRSPEEHKRTASPPSPPPSESPSPLDLNNPASNDDSGADADQYREPSEEEVPQDDPSDSEQANEPDPAGVSDKLSEDAQSNSEFTMAPEPPAVDMDKQEKEPLTGRSPAVDMDKQEEEPLKGRSPGRHVKDKAKRYGDRLHGEQTSFKKMQTENPTEEHKRTASPPSPPPSESPSPLDLNNPASNDDSGADADQNREPAEEEVPQDDPSDSEKANEPDPASVSDKLSEDVKSDPESTIAPEPPAVDMDKQEKEPLTGRSPACDVDEGYVTPQKGHVKDKAKRYGDRLHGEQTSFKKMQTDQYGEPAEEEVPQYDPLDSEKANEPDPAGVLDKLSEDAQSDPEFSMAPEQPAVDMDKQEKEPLTGRSPACDVDEGYVTPQKGHVKDKAKRYGDRLHGEQTSFKKLQTDPAGVSDKSSEDAQSDLKFSMAPEQPEPEKEAHDKEKPATSETSPAVQPHSPATKSSPNMAPEDTAGEHEEDADSDQVTGGTAEKADSSEKNESDNSSEDELSSTIPEQRGSKTLLHDINFSQEEANTNKDNQQETVKPVSEDDDKDKESDLYSAASQQPKSPTPTKSDNGNADTPQESPDAANADPDNREEEEEPKTSRDSYESDGQSDKGKGETDEGKDDIQGSLKEEKPGNESLSEDKEGQKEDEVVK